MRPPFFGMGMQSPIQPNNPYIDDTAATILVYQQFGIVSPHYNSNQIVGQPRMLSHLVHNEGAGRDRQSPAPNSEATSTNNKIYLQPDGDT